MVLSTPGSKGPGSKGPGPKAPGPKGSPVHIQHPAVTITPSNPDPDNYVNVELPPDPRGVNSIYNNEWALFQDWHDPLNDWYANDSLKAQFNLHKI